MRVIFISQYFYPENFSNNSMALALAERGYNVEVVCCVPNYGAPGFFEGYSNSSKRVERWRDISIFRAQTVARKSSALRLFLNYLWFPISGSYTVLSKVSGRPDVSFVSMPSPLFQAAVGLVLRYFRGTPCVYWVQDLWPASLILTLGIKNRTVIGMLNKVCGFLYRRADMILVQSESFRETIEAFGVDPRRIDVLPNTAPSSYRPIDLSLDDIDERFLKEKFHLMFAGNIGESQDFDNIILAAEILREYDCLVWVIVGSGRDEARVRGEIRKRGLEGHFLFLGRHAEDDVPKLLARADALLVTLKDSPIFRLTVPYKIQCYLASGKPIIASVSGEAARVIAASGAGYTATASKPSELAECVIKMMGLSDEARRRLGQNGWKFVNERYSQKVVYDKLCAVLHDVSVSGLREHK